MVVIERWPYDSDPQGGFNRGDCNREVAVIPDGCGLAGSLYLVRDQLDI